MEKFLLSCILAALLIVNPAFAQSGPGPGPAPSGGSGVTVSGSANQMVSNTGSSGLQSSAATLTTAGAMAGVTTLSTTGQITGGASIIAGAASVLGISGKGTYSSSGVGHIVLNGSAPAVTACGAGSPAVDANARDSGGTVTFGTGASSCTITFNVAYTTFVHCNVSFQASLATEGYTYSKTAIVITATALSGLADYQCAGT